MMCQSSNPHCYIFPFYFVVEESKSGMSHFGHFGFISITGSKSICAVSIKILYVTYQYTAL